jgi:hypothetical protein
VIPAYGKIIPLDNGKYTAGCLDGSCIVQEKLDGSQVSFGLAVVGKTTMHYEVLVKSKNQIVEQGNKMFQMVLDWVNENSDTLDANFTYRGEAITSLKHNTLKYERVPVGGVVLFDIYDKSRDVMLLPAELEREAKRIGLESVQTFVDGTATTVDYLIACQKHGTPMLGGKMIEGVVVKRYDLPDPQSFAQTTFASGFLKVKLVADEFKEVHRTSWKAQNPNGKDTVANLVAVYGTDARLAKAVQHLRDDALLTDTPSDIGALIKEVIRDLMEECEEEIKDKLFNHFGKEVLRGVSSKMPYYYKKEVLGLV